MKNIIVIFVVIIILSGCSSSSKEQENNIREEKIMKAEHKDINNSMKKVKFNIKLSEYNGIRAKIGDTDIKLVKGVGSVDIPVGRYTLKVQGDIIEDYIKDIDLYESVNFNLGEDKLIIKNELKDIIAKKVSFIGNKLYDLAEKNADYNEAKFIIKGNEFDIRSSIEILRDMIDFDYKDIGNRKFISLELFGNPILNEDGTIKAILNMKWSQEILDGLGLKDEKNKKFLVDFIFNNRNIELYRVVGY